MNLVKADAKLDKIPDYGQFGEWSVVLAPGSEHALEVSSLAVFQDYVDFVLA